MIRPLSAKQIPEEARRILPEIRTMMTTRKRRKPQKAEPDVGAEVRKILE